MLSLCASLTMKAEIIHNERTTNECFQINAEICLSLWLVCAMVQYSATHRHVGPIRSGRSEKQGPSAPRQRWASDKCCDRQSRKAHHVYQIATNHAVIRLSPYLIECTRNMLLMICRGTRYDGIVRITSSHAKNNQRKHRSWECNRPNK